MCDCCEDCKKYKHKYRNLEKHLKIIEKKYKLFFKKWISKKY